MESRAKTVAGSKGDVVSRSRTNIRPTADSAQPVPAASEKIHVVNPKMQAAHTTADGVFAFLMTLFDIVSQNKQKSPNTIDVGFAHFLPRRPGDKIQRLAIRLCPGIQEEVSRVEKRSRRNGFRIWKRFDKETVLGYAVAYFFHEGTQSGGGFHAVLNDRPFYPCGRHGVRQLFALVVSGYFDGQRIAVQDGLLRRFQGLQIVKFRQTAYNANFHVKIAEFSFQNTENLR
jgi:hypothetical protein